MFVVNEDKSVYVTRGDYCDIPVPGVVNGKAYQFQKGDVLRFKATVAKDCNKVVIQREFVVDAAADSFTIHLNDDDTRIGEVISKPTNYWYEVELNPDEDCQTIIGYDDDGPKILRLFPEGAEVNAEDIEVVGKQTLMDLLKTALAQAKESGEFDGKDGISPTIAVDSTEDYHRITVRDANGSNIFYVRNGKDGMSAYEYAQAYGYEGTEEEFANLLANMDSNVNHGSDIFVGDSNTTVAEYYEAYMSGKVCFMKRNMGGSGELTWAMVNVDVSKANFHSTDSNGNVMYGRLMADGTWDYQTKEADCDVFVGDASTTLAEYIEAFESGKACFLKRAYGAGGSARFWTIVKCVASYAQFLTIDDFGTVVYGTLKSDSTWETKTASTTSGVLSVNGVKPDASGNVVDTRVVDITIPMEQVIFMEENEKLNEYLFDQNEIIVNEVACIPYVTALWFITEQYDSIYEALTNGKYVRLDLKTSCARWFDEVSGMRLTPRQTSIDYMLTAAGLVVVTTQLTLLFTNGSYHNEDTDPFA